MIPRLTYTSPRAFLRRIQASTTNVAIFVEGRRDRYFYGSIAARAYGDSGTSYTVYSSLELPTGTGKSGLLKFFDFLSSQNALSTELGSVRRETLFFCDKDVDDLTGTLRHSGHIIYTQHHSLENYIFRYGRLHDGLAAAASLPPSLVEGTVGDPACWMKAAAESWREWVVLCVLAQILGVRNCCNFGSCSCVHGGPYEPLNDAAFSLFLDEMRVSAGLSVDCFEQRLSFVRSVVDTAYANDEHDRFFKGKWYVDFAKAHIDKAANGTGVDGTSLDNRILDALQATMEFSSEWSYYFTAALHEVLR